MNKHPALVSVSLDEVGNDQERLIKKFLKKVKKSEILREYLDKTSFHLTKSQKRREKIRKNKFLRNKQEREKRYY